MHRKLLEMHLSGAIPRCVFGCHCACQSSYSWGQKFSILTWIAWSIIRKHCSRADRVQNVNHLPADKNKAMWHPIKSTYRLTVAVTQYVTHKYMPIRVSRYWCCCMLYTCLFPPITWVWQSMVSVARFCCAGAMGLQFGRYGVTAVLHSYMQPNEN